MTPTQDVKAAVNATTEDHLRSLASTLRVPGARLRVDLTEAPFIGTSIYDAETGSAVADAIDRILAAREAYALPAGEGVVVPGGGWRFSINYGPDGEENYANVYAADGSFVGNLKTHHATAIVLGLNELDNLAEEAAAPPAVPQVRVKANDALHLTEYEVQVLIGTSISGCNMSPDRVFSLPIAWNRLVALDLIDRPDGLAIITDKGRAVVDRILAALEAPAGEAQFLAMEDGEFNGNAPEDEAVARAVVPEHCTGATFVFEPGVLHVEKDGSGYISVRERDWTLEDDRHEGPDGPEGGVHWIARLPVGELDSLRDFLNGDHPAPTDETLRREVERLTRERDKFATEALKHNVALVRAAEDGWKARVLDGLLTATDVWTDYGSGFRVHFLFETSVDWPWMADLNKAHSDARAARAALRGEAS